MVAALAALDTHAALNADIPRRQVDFELDPAVVPQDWYAGDPYVTSMLDALSTLFPEGERFFVDTVKALRHHVHDPELDAAVDGFIGQEAMHGREHRAFNELLLAQGARSTTKIEGQLKRLLRFVRRTLPRRQQLAATCALEHFTAMMAEALLRKEGMREGMHPSMRGLWVWHALEESEHKAVAYDVYNAAGGGYVRRTGIMVITTIIFFAFTLWAQAHFLAERKLLWKPWRLARGFGQLWIWPGWFTRLAPAYFQYFKPGFHPDDRDNAELLARWREQLFGARGELRAYLKGVHA
jgi:predicted metal-dependent hydrolase